MSASPIDVQEQEFRALLAQVHPDDYRHVIDLLRQTTAEYRRVVKSRAASDMYAFLPPRSHPPRSR